MVGTIRLTPGEAEAPRNAWYVVAFSDEVGRVPRSRAIMGDPVVLYRRENGTPVALSTSWHALVERRKAIGRLNPMQLSRIGVRP